MANTTWSTTDKTASVTLSNLNLTATSSGGNQGVRAVDRQITGKFYWEVTMTTAATIHAAGCANGVAALGSVYATPLNAVIVYGTGSIWINNVNSGVSVGSFGAGGLVLCLAVDLGNRLFWAKNGAAGTWNGNAANNPATGIGGLNISTIAGGGLPLYPAAAFGGGVAVTANFGDTAFSGAVPAGFTSGFTSGASIPTNEVVTQVAVEQWQVPGSPAMQLTQAAVEQWQVPIPAVQLTQIALEHWAAPPAPAVQLTQVALEQWATVNAANLQVVVTQVALEHWATVAQALGGGGPMISVII
jgi:hypothetical protein